MNCNIILVHMSWPPNASPPLDLPKIILYARLSVLCATKTEGKDIYTVYAQ
jgi:hypothetical protein